MPMEGSIIPASIAIRILYDHYIYSFFLLLVSGISQLADIRWEARQCLLQEWRSRRRDRFLLRFRHGMGGADVHLPSKLRWWHYCMGGYPMSSITETDLMSK